MYVVQETYALTCGHTYHTTCITTFAKAKNVDMANLKCPQCKLNANDLAEDPCSSDLEGPDVIVMARLPSFAIEDTLLPDTVMESTFFAEVAATPTAVEAAERAETQPVAAETHGAAATRDAADRDDERLATATDDAADGAVEPGDVQTSNVKAKAKAKGKAKSKAKSKTDTQAMAAAEADQPVAAAGSDASAAGEQHSTSTWPAASAAQWPPATSGSRDASPPEGGGRPADVPGTTGGVAPPSLELAVPWKAPSNIGAVALPNFDNNFLCDSCGRRFPMEKASCNVRTRSGFPRLLVRIAARPFLVSISCGLLETSVSQWWRQFKLHVAGVPAVV